MTKSDDPFKPTISLWQHYVTIVAVGLACWMNSVTGAAVALAVLVAGAAFQGAVEALTNGGRE